MSVLNQQFMSVLCQSNDILDCLICSDDSRRVSSQSLPRYLWRGWIAWIKVHRYAKDKVSKDQKNETEQSDSSPPNAPVTHLLSPHFLAYWTDAQIIR